MGSQRPPLRHKTSTRAIGHEGVDDHSVLLAPETSATIDRLTRFYAQELIDFRRDLHANPEPSREEFRTTTAIVNRLAAAGLRGRILPTGTGLLCDIGAPGPHVPRIALRADLDALRVTDGKAVPYRSTKQGICHACGHDVHTAVVLGAGLILNELATSGVLRHGVRLIFQPAEEVFPGGALDVLAAGGLHGVDQIFAVHCDPRLDAGTVGLRTGSLTAAADLVRVRLTGPGGHTARPHLTADLVHALAALLSQLPAALARCVDPRSGLSLVWGRVHAGGAPNAIPMAGEAAGTLRCLDADVCRSTTELVKGLAHQIVAPFRANLDIQIDRGVPPVVNDEAAVSILQTAADAMLGHGAGVTTEQSLGGEDFAWYLTKVPGAMARLGVRTPGDTAQLDLHQGTFDVDEQAIAAGVRVLVAAVMLGGRIDGDEDVLDEQREQQ